ncbi:hypothetical protein [Mycobacteroides abscessus]|uniref:hypothetical protein n=1 Tax=Mycobacteroides abscessus TaxID=36809 RepID=UPI0011C44128|nr:hypothetical protein [Mycobacteroides abscessus]
MARHTCRYITCDAAGCDSEFSVEGKLDWFVVQARARSAGWRQDGNTHLCPTHRRVSPARVRELMLSRR